MLAMLHAKAVHGLKRRNVSNQHQTSGNRLALSKPATGNL